MSSRPIRLVKKELDGKVRDLNAAERNVAKAAPESIEFWITKARRSAILKEVEVLKVELFGEWAPKSMGTANSTS